MASYLAELKSFRRLSREEFVSEPAAHHLAERYLHLACECVLDIAHHVVSDQGYRQPGSYRDAIEVLHEEGLLETAPRRWLAFCRRPEVFIVPAGA